MGKFVVSFAWRPTLFLGVQYRDIAIIIDNRILGTKGYIIGLGWLEMFLGLRLDKELK